MYFEAQPPDRPARICSARSADGLTWEPEPGVRFGADNEWRYGSPRAVPLPDGRWRLYCHRYTQPLQMGLDAGNHIVSAISADGLTFEEEPGVRIPQTTALETFAVYAAEVVGVGTAVPAPWRMYYAGWTAEPVRGRIFSATSLDGLAWAKDPEPNVEPAGLGVDAFDAEKCSEPSVMQLPDGRYRIYYEACDEGQVWRILSASARGGECVTDRLRVVTANILNTSDGWEGRRPVLKAGLAALDADLIALQETVVRSDYDQVVDVVGEGWHVVHSESRDEKGEGTSIASRWPIEAVWNVDHALTDRARRDPGRRRHRRDPRPGPDRPAPVRQHFPSWTVDHERERELQAVATAHGIAAALAGRQLPVVIGGDMDAEPDAASIRFWSGRQALDGLSVCYVDCWAALHPGHSGEDGDTFAARNGIRGANLPTWPYRRIDYLFVRCNVRGGLQPERCEVVLDEPVDGVWPSDYFGVMADLVRLQARSGFVTASPRGACRPVSPGPGPSSPR